MAKTETDLYKSLRARGVRKKVAEAVGPCDQRRW